MCAFGVQSFEKKQVASLMLRADFCRAVVAAVAHLTYRSSFQSSAIR
jgi:hypothetical protein